MRSRSAAFDARISLCTARNSLRSIVSWFSVRRRVLGRAGPRPSRPASRACRCCRPRASARTTRPRRTTGVSTSTIAVAQRAAVALGDRVGAHVLGAEPRDAERHAGGPRQAAGVADHHLEAPAAEVEAHRGRRVEHDRRADRTEDQARLLQPADHLDAHAGFRLDAVDHLAAVLGAPDRAGGLGQHLGGAGGLGEQAEAANGGDGLVGRGRRDRPVAAHDVAEAQHLLLLHERVDVPVGVHVGHEEVERVRPEVDGGDAHRPQR